MEQPLIKETRCAVDFNLLRFLLSIVVPCLAPLWTVHLESEHESSITIPGSLFGEMTLDPHPVSTILQRLIDGVVRRTFISSPSEELPTW
jgi:hypothetical protein